MRGAWLKLLTAAGVEPRSFHALVSTWLLMDLREQHFAQATATKPHFLLSPLFLVVGQCLTLSAVTSLVLFARVDVGLARHGQIEEVFLSHRSFGFLEQIQQVAERGRKQPRARFLRLLWYFGVAYRFLFRSRLAGFTVEVDGTKVADDAVLVTVANVETYHGFLPLTPAAVAIDGLFDVAVVPRVSKLTMMVGLLTVRLGRWARWRRLKIHRGRRVVVTTPRRREEIVVGRGALPLLVRAGTVEKLRRRVAEDERASPA